MEDNSLEQTLTKMREFIRRDVAAGFATPDQIVKTVVQIVSRGQDSSVLLLYAKNIVRETIEAHIKEQVSWEEFTDCDRLDQAFEELDSQGIISRQNFSCCGTCGTGEIIEEMESVQSAGRHVRGYTFYHEQDTESAVDGDGLYLNYGSIEEDAAAYVEIGHEIVRIVNQHGLTTVWSGNLEERIFVMLDWKRRR